MHPCLYPHLWHCLLFDCLPIPLQGRKEGIGEVEDVEVNMGDEEVGEVSDVAVDPPTPAHSADALFTLDTPKLH